VKSQCTHWKMPINLISTINDAEVRGNLTVDQLDLCTTVANRDDHVSMRICEYYIEAIPFDKSPSSSFTKIRYEDLIGGSYESLSFLGEYDADWQSKLIKYRSKKSATVQKLLAPRMNQELTKSIVEKNSHIQPYFTN
jgi:hypothetical protein